ncbi:26S proteasome regulatory complex subunit PSMD10 protein [Dioscorea alata]|uniref:26S proteasome regulatory complex subunit PSMD10 protein n=1 Tax=Dioscorea alata TaxID=55571 RepID=A0ACB7W102_DIOAL|nr:26S proteasome regulatory complex subunit PSMD10 protein [Dioscorea alata]
MAAAMMTVFSVGGGGGTAGRQVYPVDSEAEASQRLVEATHRGDARAVAELLMDTMVDVNYPGTVCLRGRRAEVALREESPDEVRIELEEFRTDVSALFLAAHSGNLPLVRKLLSVGADVNQKLFRGYATTAAAREGRGDVLELLLRAGAAQPACEEALLEACAHGQAKLAWLLMDSDQIRPNVAVHALVSACSRGFVDVVDTLIKCFFLNCMQCGVNADTTDRVLLRSLKPSLHTNIDCTALVAAIVSRQGAVVRQLLQAGVRKDLKVSLGAWSWDTTTGEEFRVGAGLAEPYNVAWCAVEYFESTGTILRMLLQHHSPNTLHSGRSLLHHAILCGNHRAADTLLACGADCELPIKTARRNEFRPIHMAARLGHAKVLQSLIDTGCDLDSRTECGETALMLCARFKRHDCLSVLASAGADLGLVSSSGSCAALIASSNRWGDVYQEALLNVIRSGKIPRSSNPNIFSPMMFAAHYGDVSALEVLVMHPDINLDEQDKNGFSAIMIAAREGHVDAFRFLVFAGANVKLCNNAGETAIALSQSSKNHDLFEQVMLDFALEKGNAGGFYALHCAARRGDMAAVRLLTNRGIDMNVPDGDGCTPLMLAAREGHGTVCELLLACGAQYDIRTPQGDTALSLARANKTFGNPAEGVILDAMARDLVTQGCRVKKHTKKGKGRPHRKMLKMVVVAGVLRWGKAACRNVICREAEVGGSSAFVRNRKRKGDAYEAGALQNNNHKREGVSFCLPRR